VEPKYRSENTTMSALLPPHPVTNPPSWQWDVFCRVIDNWGDIGVCWRLAAQLAAHGQRVRLWVDDPAALAWMAPGALEGHWPGIRVLRWEPWDAARDVLTEQSALPAQSAPPTHPPCQVLVEAFGCDIEPARVQALVGPATRPVWLNLEYLSAEPYVERSHGLPSPVMAGPLAGWTKWFFYPGFTERTGGLLRGEEAGHTEPAANGPPQGFLFCYEPAALPGLARVSREPGLHWRVAAGRATAAVQQAAAWQHMTCQFLPLMDQPGFDAELRRSSINFVRGEDSLCRALWAGRPLVWQLYPQDDGAHAAKLSAFLDWLEAPESLRRFHRIWNGMEEGPLPALDLPAWGECVAAARARLLAQDDLCSRLLGFVAAKMP
jgi:uncharacterized repeat protein (TIGR03837 family)